ncbi:thrombopoietin [Oxyura jamaicensis]|uniref:thrombopoietin n=1 Tax=Oxyura jamaicensis TaxID=8884 RepID=UPI0015A51630|nr:thrombopoietin [Oxyura jamaicensis]
MQGRSPQASMELNRLLLLTSFLLHVKEGRASPARLVCDTRLIQKYIAEAKDMEKKANQCQAPSTLSSPVALPPVDIKLPQWKTKSNDTKRREILCNLALLVGAVRGARSQESQECWARQLSQLYRHAEFFLRLLQTWEAPQEEPWEPGCSPGSKEINTAVIFLAYQRLLQGKLHFFFHDLAKDSCDRGQGAGRDPSRGV